MAAGSIILGIDPGYARMGWGVVEVADEGGEFLKMECLGFGCVETPKEEELATRLAFLNDALLQIIGRYKPHDIAIEDLYFAKNQKTALNVAHARGIVLMRAAYHSGKIFQYRPNQVKLATTGVSSADKKLMQEQVARILRFPSIPKPDDAADALAVAICHAHHTRHQAGV